MNPRTRSAVLWQFLPYTGDLMNLVHDANYHIFRWRGPGKILFSVSKRGCAAVCHFACDPPGLRHLKKACCDFMAFCRTLYDWCTMIMTCVTTNKPSIERLLKKLDFQFLTDSENGRVFVWVS
jgi:hypothetical protein